MVIIIFAQSNRFSVQWDVAWTKQRMKRIIYCSKFVVFCKFCIGNIRLHDLTLQIQPFRVQTDIKVAVTRIVKFKLCWIISSSFGFVTAWVLMTDVLKLQFLKMSNPDLKLSIKNLIYPSLYDVYTEIGASFLNVHPRENYILMLL